MSRYEECGLCPDRQANRIMLPFPNRKSRWSMLWLALAVVAALVAGVMLYQIARPLP
jgi:hypothetical protein